MFDRKELLRIAWIVALVITIGGCENEMTAPGAPIEVSLEGIGPHFNHNAAASAEKGYIDGWLDGEDVSLHYTSCSSAKSHRRAAPLPTA
jgi:hypothetical protein